MSCSTSTDTQRDRTANIHVFNSRVVELMPAHRLAQQVGGLHTNLAPRIDCESPAGAQRTVFPRLHNRFILRRNFNHRRPKSIDTRNQNAARRKKPSAGINDRRDVLLKPRQYPAQVRNDHIRLLGQSHFRGEALNKLDAIGYSTIPSCIAPDLYDVVRLNRKHETRTQFARNEREESRTTAKFDDDRTRSDRATQRRDVRVHTRTASKHFSVSRDVIHVRPAPKLVKRACRNQNSREWPGTIHRFGPGPNEVSLV